MKIHRSRHPARDWRDPEARDGMLLPINFRETAIVPQSNPNIRAAVSIAAEELHNGKDPVEFTVLVKQTPAIQIARSKIPHSHRPSRTVFYAPLQTISPRARYRDGSAFSMDAIH